MFSEDYKRGVCLDDLDVGLDWNALIMLILERAREINYRVLLLVSKLKYTVWTVTTTISILMRKHLYIM